MSRQLAHIALFLLAVLCLSACDVHELPVGSSDVDVTLHITLDRELRPYKTVEYPLTKAEEEGLEARCELRVYQGVPGNFEREPFISSSFTLEGLADLERDVSLQLRPGRYLVQAWVDFVPQDGSPFWDASSFQEVRIIGEYTGGDPRRDAFYIQQELPLETLITAGSVYEATLTLHRPLAQYRFVATDKEEFLQFWAMETAIRQKSIVKPVIEASELKDFRVRVVYPQYLPNAFNLWTGAASDAGTGYSFWTKMQLREDGNVNLAWDWVLTGPDEGLVVVSLEFYDPEGEYISTFRNFELPLWSSGVTTVQGRILTAGVDSGIAIDPTFDGEFNVYL